MENKIYTMTEMRERSIFTDDYRFMDKPCIVTGKIVLKAQARNHMICLFFQLSDGRKIITPVFWWQKNLQVRELPLDEELTLTYVPGQDGQAILASAEPVTQS